jgi:hypothetical protein
MLCFFQVWGPGHGSQSCDSSVHRALAGPITGEARIRHRCINGKPICIWNQHNQLKSCESVCMTLSKVTCVCRHPRVFIACSAQIICAVLSLMDYHTMWYNMMQYLIAGVIKTLLHVCWVMSGGCFESLRPWVRGPTFSRALLVGNPEASAFVYAERVGPDRVG